MFRTAPAAALDALAERETIEPPQAYSAERVEFGSERAR
jgi:hypothetical protein